LRVQRRDLLKLSAFGALSLGATASAEAQPESPLRGTGDLGVIIERATGSALIVETTSATILHRVDGLGDMSHASLVYSADARFAYVFGRDGGLTKIDILLGRVVNRVVQGGNAIGGAISDDGRLIAVSNYEPGGVRVFDSETLAMVADIPAIGAEGRPSKTVGLVDVPGRRFIYGLWDAGEIWIADFSSPGEPVITRHRDIGRLPYDGNITPDGRHYIAGLFGEDGLVHVDMWADAPTPRKVLAGYGKGETPLPVYKMPHLEGWGATGNGLVLPAIGRHEVITVGLDSFAERGRVAVHGQPVFCVAQPDGRRIWVNFAPPHNDTIDVIDVTSQQLVDRFKPGPGVLHMEFTPRGGQCWMSVRDRDEVQVRDTKSHALVARLPARKPSGIFFTHRAHRIGQ
jgi:protein NirF